MTDRVSVFAPGRVNLIGEHVDYAGGVVLPMAIGWGTTVSGERGGDCVTLTSTAQEGVTRVSLDGRLLGEAAPWAARVAGVVAAVGPSRGLVGEISGDLPLGAGLSSSASSAVALALALGFDGSPLELARRLARAEARALGVPCGLMDPLVVAAAHAGRALRIDCATGRTREVVLPDDWRWALVDSGLRRDLAGSDYAHRRDEVAAAARRLGPLARASLDDLEHLADPLLRRRARHVIGEMARVERFEEALEAEDLPAAGALLDASAASLSADFAVSTPALDRCVEAVRAHPGVVGARPTGAGFGGFVLALGAAGAELPGVVVRPGAGALGCCYL